MSTEAVTALFANAVIARGHLEPPYRQIASLVHDAVIDGLLENGCVLPPERAIATQLGVSRATVARALSSLAATGLLERRVGHGTVVAFDLESWRVGPTGGIPWGAMLTTLPTTSKRPRTPHADIRAGIASDLAVPARDAASIILTAGIEDSTRFLTDALVRRSERGHRRIPAVDRVGH